MHNNSKNKGDPQITSDIQCEAVRDVTAKVPVTIAFEGVPESDAVQQAIWRHAAELEHFSRRITSCSVVVAHPHHHGHHGGLYSVRIDLTVPGNTLMVNHEHRFDHAHENLYVAIRDAFHAARRRLEDHARRERGAVKSHTQAAAGARPTTSPA